MECFAGWIIRTSETDKGIAPHINVHRFTTARTIRSIFYFQPAFAENKLSIAQLAFVALFAVLGFPEFIKCIRVASRALFVNKHDNVSLVKKKVFLINC
jgi:hypothetical protein